MKDIFTLLTSEDKKDIINAVKELIIKQVEKDLSDNYSYLFNVDSLEEMIEEAVDEIKEELKEEFKRAIRGKIKIK